ncbi:MULTISPECIES: oligosaccharide flippase family protein [Citrobacter]|uniref:oligosaccharide flippase family protein n=1 Tax=Citrobacter TaxID=544 RepID=UPI000B8EDD8B|nr:MULTISPECIES: oligosaccharide flippase family protein [Citrobacter]EGT5654423.1 oligosaccharide flippase family protein [Citrobacter braakii]MBA8129309.1 oligosaccharide flippase family protein [Citrobacter sp. RHBSTW-00013]
MSYKKNIIVGYFAQIYVSAIGILILPLYIKYMGAEAYGLIGFFTMLQALFNLLDLGLTPTIGRETARYRGGVISVVDYRRLLRTLSMIFLIIAIIGSVIIISLSNVISNKWLNIKSLDIDVVRQCVEVMGLCISLRWMGGLYRGVLIGTEKIDWLGYFNISIASLRFIGVFGAMKVYGFTPYVFFCYQLIVALIEFSVLFMISTKLIYAIGGTKQKIGWSFQPIKPLLKFSLMIAFTSAVWVFITQSDKLILSGLLSLTDYGHFTLGVLVASGIILLNGPISSTILPRLARLYAEGDLNNLKNLYSNTTMLVSSIAGAASVVISFWSKELIYLWTGNTTLAEQVAPILKLYAIGNGLLVVSAFPYYLQYALGSLKLHFLGNCLMLILLIPSVAYLSIKFGGIGAGIAWVLSNAFYLLIWCGYSHKKLLPGMHWHWLLKDIGAIYLVAIIINLVLFSLIDPTNFSRLEIALMLAFISMITLICTGLLYFINLSIRSKNSNVQ